MSEKNESLPAAAVGRRPCLEDRIVAFVQRYAPQTAATRNEFIDELRSIMGEYAANAIDYGTMEAEQ